MAHKGQDLLAFHEYRLDPVQRLLFLGGQQIPLAPKAFDTLLALVEAEGRIVEKEEVLRKVWPDTFVEEGSLARNISVLRKALGESPDDQRYIQTIARRGYRFVAPVTTVPSSPEVIEDGLSQVEASSSLSGLSLKIAAGVTLLILITAGLLLWRTSTTGELSRTGRGGPLIQSVAVLPLQNLSGNSEQDYFADGITEALITSLAQIRALKVISRTSTMRYKGTVKPVPEIARELGVDAIIEGSVQREGNRVRLSAQLIQARTDRHVWARSYERDLSSILGLEGELATLIAGEVKVQVEPDARKRLNRSPPISSAAQEEYLLARHQQDVRDESHLKQAIQHYDAAIQLEPEFAAAFAGLAGAWVQRGILGTAGFRESQEPARKAAIRALELDSQLAEAHEALAYILMFYDIAWGTAEQEFRRAIELNSSDVDAHVYYATLLEILGRFEEAVAEGRRAVELDPVSVTVTSEYGRVLFRARRYEKAIPQFQRALELDPHDGVTHYRLADAYIQTGQFDEALKLFPTTRAQAARAYALMGRTGDARSILATREAEQGGVDFALAYFALGDRDRGFELLTRVFDDRLYASLIVCDPRWDEVRGDSRFQALVHRLGLPKTAGHW
jgi:TolB-like protein/DNA-binding winged helix-turn-helix (wHTH) protein/cytochrome c-type biogenesis protein CcmH/NrfG